MAASGQRLDYWQLVRDVRFGQKRTLRRVQPMSVLLPIADIDPSASDVRFSNRLVGVKRFRLHTTIVSRRCSQ
jgi:hypothetical protein